MRLNYRIVHDQCRNSFKTQYIANNSIMYNIIYYIILLSVACNIFVQITRPRDCLIKPVEQFPFQGSPAKNGPLFSECANDKSKRALPTSPWRHGCSVIGHLCHNQEHQSSSVSAQYLFRTVRRLGIFARIDPENATANKCEMTLTKLRFMV